MNLASFGNNDLVVARSQKVTLSIVVFVFNSIIDYALCFFFVVLQQTFPHQMALVESHFCNQHSDTKKQTIRFPFCSIRRTQQLPENCSRITLRISSSPIHRTVRLFRQTIFEMIGSSTIQNFPPHASISVPPLSSFFYPHHRSLSMDIA